MAAVAEKLKTLKIENGDAAMLPRECYTSPEFFEFEREAVFARSWVCVGRVEQIPDPGDYLAVNVAGEPLLVARNAERAIKAMSAVCRHRGEVVACASGHALSTAIAHGAPPAPRSSTRGAGPAMA